MESSTLIQIALAYTTIALFKGWLVMQTTPLFLNAMVRSRYRRHGSVSLTYFSGLLFLSAVIFLALILFWPLVWYMEGRYFWFKYNAFSMARQCMRIVKGHNPETTQERPQCP